MDVEGSGIDAAAQTRRARLAATFAADAELRGAIADQCSGCRLAMGRAFALAGMVGRGTATLEDAKSGLARDTGECKGPIYSDEVYDGSPTCWREQQLGREGVLRGLRPFND